jgi:catechol 2,3-dioxygenase
MMKPAIAAIGHLAVRTPDVDACVAQAIDLMGLAETARDETGVYLTEGRAHHSLHYIDAAEAAADHVGLEAADAEALEAIRGRLDDAGIPWTASGDDMLGEAIRVTPPGEFVFEIYVGMPHGDVPELRAGVRPNRFGHVTLRLEDPAPMKDFLCDILGFRVSDAVAGGFFLRCNVDHHGVGVLPGPGQLHHHAWEVSSIADIGRICDRVHERGLRVLWGPVRHGAGNNIAAYFADPAGTVVEYYTDMERIYDDADHVIPVWDPTSEDWVSLWQGGRPEGFQDYGIPPAGVADRLSGEPA